MSDTEPWWRQADRWSAQRRLTWAEWEVRQDYTRSEPPEWMRPAGRPPAETIAARLLSALLIIAVGAVPAAVCIWSLR
ncbi:MULTISPECIES: hypothetical protein [Protofrankia]|uniref:Uncharacterized protein n=1 Tax=Protofrankia coriariae TaxID=1562887 RepID=A0ABR5F4D3_9ACTN|nr:MULTISPECIES: hypothetical protein [Protofrankia]KLL11589.1 hypothetical protein FrCorBMG51_11185 [Protofrankia coriariae]ONH35726.1 hypothetical protein BL254_10580 [Protofrankia sp. BMG5.30]